MRTAYLADPYTCTCATPVTVPRRCDRNVSAYSLRSVRDISSELRLNISTGALFALPLLYDGGVMPCGNWRADRDSAACTSAAADSRSRSSVNCRLMFVL